jgi:hypothetical protein
MGGWVVFVFAAGSSMSGFAFIWFYCPKNRQENEMTSRRRKLLLKAKQTGYLPSAEPPFTSPA